MPPTTMSWTSLFLPTTAGAAAAATGSRHPSFSHRSHCRVPTTRLRRAARLVVSASASPASPASSLDALIFDCDGVILESEHLHRQAYNDAFAHFGVRCPPASADPLYWDEAFYDELQNRIGGGKPKMRWYFGENGWPSSNIFETPPSTDSDKEKLVDIIQVEPRPGVLRLMDEVKGAGIKLAVCSAATKSSVIMCLENLIGLERFKGLDCFLAGDDVKLKKPDPTIYVTAAEKLGVQSKNCLVVEDSVIGLLAAKGAGMSCIITYTPSTASQDFTDAIATYPDLSDVRLEDLKLLLQKTLVTG
ncbi:haloacid dehalogenase-like hydrolase domain-containing protein At4g39970 isoform X2 [Setaria viridis]|uniref:haloacid dehalogenase-like hydrolase domain-containing protein At4g39970 isoform X2 n=1 Tax=Setaria viridis TaxID=4556 RepID=UPI0014937DBC|nr:haloacid dehalogenase-like hydrolase domain-containing protein At4g39970 isoform X2 [Setaria viridis]